MALLEVIQFPDPRLKCVSRRIDKITDELRELAQNMCEVMYDEPGIGLAAPQVGADVRLIVVDTEWRDEDKERHPIIMVNPEISEAEGKIVWDEGCLSVPDFTADVTRAERVRVIGTDLDGKPIEIHAEELQAVCFQHEIDHLDGILFIDRISRLKRGLYVKRRKKQILAEEDDEVVDTRGSRL
ncbi:MAG: peptide deformylase [Deltaproteobacteria bacterium]|nr:peptide deformylase [Deltaproteobacteria bacterium]MBW2293474.1 peptide deformylase [Deltaproteobacteria bacterium]